MKTTIAETTAAANWIQGLAAHWRAELTGGALIAVLFVWDAVEKATHSRHPVPRWLYAAIVAVTFIYASFRTWLVEYRKNEESTRKLDEMYADIVLDFLKAKCRTNGTFGLADVALSVHLSREDTQRGFKFLAKEYHAVHEELPGLWRFNAVRAKDLRPGRQRIHDYGTADEQNE